MTDHGIESWRAIAYNRTLFWVGIAFLGFAVALIPLWLLDPTELLGVSRWEKPLKFFISTGIFCLTYSWLSAHISILPSLVRWTGIIIAVSLAIEMVAIAGASLFVTTSHFNVSSPVATAVWAVMATFVNIVFAATIVLSLLIIFEKNRPFLLKLALAMGSAITAVGMGLAFLMTSPTAEQLSNFQGIAGAHSVGVSDGGPGLPFLGWSTAAGDLRVGHFFGLHAIQVAIVLLLIQRYLPQALRLPTILVGNLTYLGFVLVMTGQALRGESVVNPGAETLLQLVWLLVAAVIAFTVLAIIGYRREMRARHE